MPHAGPFGLPSFLTLSDRLTIELKSRLSRSDSVSDKGEDSNPPLQPNDSGLCTELSRIFSESDATCCV